MDRSKKMNTQKNGRSQKRAVFGCRQKWAVRLYLQPGFIFEIVHFTNSECPLFFLWPVMTVHFSKNHKIIYDENSPFEVVDDPTRYTIYLLWTGTWNV